MSNQRMVIFLSIGELINLTTNLPFLSLVKWVSPLSDYLQEEDFKVIEKEKGKTKTKGKEELGGRRIGFTFYAPEAKKVLLAGEFER